MLLENLPNELLSMVIAQLSPEDCFPLRKTSRRFHSLIDSEGIFLMNPTLLLIDFVHQGICAFRGMRGTEAFGIMNVGLITSETSPLLPILYDRFRAFCDVGDCWLKHVEKYIRKLNEYHYQKSSGVNLRLALPTTSIIPEQLLKFSVNLRTIHIGTENWQYACEDPLPKSLEVWLSKVTRASTHGIQLDYALSPTQLDAFHIPEFCCCVKDQSTIHILNKVLNNSLPELTFWNFRVEQHALCFQEKLMTLFGVLPDLEDPIIYYSQQVRIQIKQFPGALGYFFSIWKL